MNEFEDFVAKMDAQERVNRIMDEDRDFQLHFGYDEQEDKFYIGIYDNIPDKYQIKVSVRSNLEVDELEQLINTMSKTLARYKDDKEKFLDWFRGLNL